jgi:cell division protein ZapE
MHHVRLDGDTDYRRVPGSATDLGSAVESTADSGSAGGFTAGVWATDPPAGAPGGSETVRVRDREFEVVSAGAELWITFDQLCSAATSAIEYLDWAERFARWIILDVPGFDGLVEAPRQRFVTAVDVLVDRDVETVFVSRLSREQFAASAEGTRDAERLLSRLALLA